MSGVSFEALKARVDHLSLSMLGLQKELRHLVEDENLGAWPEVREQVAWLQGEMATVQTEIQLLRQQRLGQSVIDACFPRVSGAVSAYIEEFDALARACHNARILRVQSRFLTSGDEVVSLQCELDPGVDRQVLRKAGILAPVIEVELARCRSLTLTRQLINGVWGGERIAAWEISPPSFSNETGYSVQHRIFGSNAMVLEVAQWGIRISEVLE